MEYTISSSIKSLLQKKVYKVKVELCLQSKSIEASISSLLQLKAGAGLQASKVMHDGTGS